MSAQRIAVLPACLVIAVLGSASKGCGASGPEPPIARTSLSKGLIGFGCQECGAEFADEVWVVRADGSGLHRVLGGISSPCSSSPSWSPDGRRIACVDYPEGGDIWVLDANGQNRRRRLAGGPPAGPPAWSPDGTRLVYASLSTPPLSLDWPDEIFVIDVDGSGKRLLVRGRGRERSPTWSPDGTTIAFLLQGDERTAEGRNDIYLMHPDGSHRRRLTRDSPVDNWARTNREIAWAPDGREIAFVSGGIDVISRDGKARREVPGTWETGFIGGIDWRPEPAGS